MHSMANSQSYALFLTTLFVSFSGFLTLSSLGHEFLVGGKDGWGLNPSEKYNSWAERLRFQVNDTLLFKYNKESDSVLVVNKNDYDQCSSANPISKLDGGDSIFKFDRSGPFFFISGNKSRCDGGQKLVIVVLAVRGKKSTPPSPIVAPPPSPTVAPPTSSSPESPAPASSPSDAEAPGSSYGPSANISTPTGPPPPRSSFAAAAWSPSVVVVSIVAVVISACLGAGFY